MISGKSRNGVLCGYKLHRFGFKSDSHGKRFQIMEKPYERISEVFCYMVTIGAYDLSARDFAHNM